MLDSFIALFQFGVNLILQIISTSGYSGVFFFMVLESALMPIPSEIVMPFSGYLASLGKFDLIALTIVSSVANLVGSIIAYLIGLKVGRKLVLKYGKFILLKEKYLMLTEKWFKKYGGKAIFFSRMMPVVRTVISLPAGIGKMNFKKFSLYTLVGSMPWNFALTYIGFWLGKNWTMVHSYSKELDIIVVMVLIVVAVSYLWKLRKNRK